MKYLCQLSGGRDSTAMSVYMLETHGAENVELMFSDTGAELPDMYEYIKRLDDYLFKKYQKRIIVIKPIIKDHVATLKDIEVITTKDIQPDFENGGLLKLIRSDITKGENKGRKRGLPLSDRMSPCTKELKVRPFQLYLSRNYDINDVEVCIGFVERERKRVGKMQENLPYKVKFPLIELKWNEKEVDDYLKEHSLYNELYTHYDRTGCFLCPKQSLSSWKALHEYHKPLFDRAVDLELECIEKDYLIKYFRADKTPLTDIHDRYDIAEKTARLFDIRNWPEKDQICMCK